MPPDKSAKPTVLVIDDDEDIRTTIRDVLEDQGFAVACAANGREALDMLLRDESKPALILLDLTMPEMDGWTFRQEQQKVPRLAQIPVVLFSGHHDASAGGAIPARGGPDDQAAASRGPRDAGRAAFSSRKAKLTLAERALVRRMHLRMSKENVMLIILAVILGIAWFMGFTVFHVTSTALHLLVVFAIAALVVHLFRRDRSLT